MLGVRTHMFTDWDSYVSPYSDRVAEHVVV